MPCHVDTSGDDAWERRLLTLTVCGVFAQLESKGELTAVLSAIDWPPREPRQRLSYRQFAEEWWEDHKKADQDRKKYRAEQERNESGATRRVDPAVNEMIERVARAICFSRQSCEWCKVACLASRAELEKSPQWTKALAAIGAMRDPADAS